MGRRGTQGGPYGVGDEDEAAQRPRDPRLVWLEGRPQLRDAAVVSETFGLDPVVVLGELDPFNVLVRLAAHNVVLDEQRKAEKKRAAARRKK